MIVVAIVGVLAVIALVGYQKYTRSAAAGEARAMLLSIRGAEDSYKSEMLVYKDCTTNTGTFATGSFYTPRDYTTTNGSKVGWGGTGTAADKCFQELNVHAAGPVRFAYAVAAGGPGAINASAPPDAPNWPYPGSYTTTEPWFVTVAIGHQLTANGHYSVMYTSSAQAEVTVCDDTQ